MKSIILGVPVDVLSMGEVVSKVSSIIQDKNRLRIGVVNAAKLVNMKRDSDLQKDVLSSDLILADGAAVVWASKLMGNPLPERVAGIDLMFELLSLANKKQFRVYFLGASEEVSTKVVEKVREEYPDVVVAGRQNGYFADEDEKKIAEKIAQSEANIIFVAMTSPKKELFMARWDDVIGVNVVHGVGGSFDVFAGKVERAPIMWQKYGLEWLYRVKQEPRRLWKRYLVTNTLFLWHLIAAMFSKFILRRSD